MILPIYIYGSPVLRKTAANITPDYPGLQQFIADMWETGKDSHSETYPKPIRKSLTAC